MSRLEVADVESSNGARSDGADSNSRARTIGRMARESGLSVSALRFYDGAGVLTPASDLAAALRAVRFAAGSDPELPARCPGCCST